MNTVGLTLLSKSLSPLLVTFQSLYLLLWRLGWPQYSRFPQRLESSYKVRLRSSNWILRINFRLSSGKQSPVPDSPAPEYVRYLQPPYMPSNSQVFIHYTSYFIQYMIYTKYNFWLSSWPPDPGEDAAVPCCGEEWHCGPELPGLPTPSQPGQGGENWHLQVIRGDQSLGKSGWSFT